MRHAVRVPSRVSRVSHACAGEAEAIYARSAATARGLEEVSAAITGHGGSEAAGLRVAEQYVAAFGSLAKAGNTMLLPASANDPASMVAQAMSIYKNIGGGGSAAPRAE